MNLAPRSPRPPRPPRNTFLKFFFAILASFAIFARNPVPLEAHKIHYRGHTPTQSSAPSLQMKNINPNERNVDRGTAFFAGSRT